jgi:nucleoside-diphosphate-sugar epimerase
LNAAPPPSLRALVTGAAGFVGRAVCRRLAPVRAAVRTTPEPTIEGAAETVAVGDVGPGTDWADALRGIEVVVHLAARAHRAWPEDELRRVNVEGTRRLAEAARAAGVRRLVYLSSAGVLGACSPGRPFTEADPPRPHDAYTRSKAEAERALAATSGLEAVILRAPLVYGPGAPANFRELREAVDRERLLPLGAVKNRRHLVYVENLADAVAAAAERPEATGRTYLVADDDAVSTPDLIRRLAEALGRRARVPSVPLPLLRAAAFILGQSGRLARLAASFEVDASLLRRELGWRPRVPMADALRATASAFRASFES